MDDRQVLGRGPAQPRVDDEVGGPHHGDRDQRHDRRRRHAEPEKPHRLAGAEAVRPAGVPDRQDDQEQQHRNRGQHAHLRGHGRAERHPGEREVEARPPPRPPQQPDRRQQEAGRRYVERGQRPVRDDVGRERVQGERHQPAHGADEVTGEREDDQPEQQRQHDHRQPRPQHQPPRIVARFVQEVPSELRLIADEGAVEVRVGERQPGRDDQLAQRRMLGVVPQAVLLQVDHRRAHVHGLVDGRGLLHGRRDHRDRHLGEERDHDEREQPPPVSPQPFACSSGLPRPARRISARTFRSFCRTSGVTSTVLWRVDATSWLHLVNC